VGYVITIDANGLERHRESTATLYFMMKKQILIPAFLGGLMTFSLTTQAQDRPGQGGRGGEGGRGGGIREAMIKKYDKNGDGKLDEDERPSREEMQEFFRAQLGGGQTRPSGGQTRPSGGQTRPSGGQTRPSGGQTRPGGGQTRPGQGGRDAAPQQNMRDAMLKKFDKNGDGKLDEDERPSREEMQEFFRSQLGGGQGGRPGGGQGGPGQGRPGAGEPGQGRPGQGGGFGERGQGGRGGFRPPNPVMEAIDKNKDGTLSAEELKNAAKALSALDKNKDGKIDQEEMRPQFNRGQGGREGFSRPGQGGQGGEGRPGQGGRENPRGSGTGGRENPRGPGAGGRENPRGPGAGGRENPRGPREGDRNQPRPERSDA
jgi:Ca2+-binding EF-hand superfamily protein